MGWIGCVRCEKFQCDLMAQTCPLIAPVQHVLHQVSCSNKTLANAPKHYENAPKHEFRVQWGGSHAFIAKNSDVSSWHEQALIAPVQPISHRVSCSNETIHNAPKHYKTNQFMSLASNGMNRVRSFRKTLMRFRGANFFINCTSSIRFAPSFVQ